MSDLDQTIVRIVAETTGVTLTSADSGGDEGGAPWDSLAHVSLVEALEEHFNVQFTAEQMLDMTTVARIRDALVAQGVSS